MAPLSLSLSMAAEGGRIVVAPGAPQFILAEVLNMAALSPQASVAQSRRPGTASLAAGVSEPASPGGATSILMGLRQRGRRQGRPRSCPVGDGAESCATLFSGERVGTNSTAKRGTAVIFRKPMFSRAPPHTRPIFVVGQNGTDPRMCVDNSAPGRFSSGESARLERAIRKGLSGAPTSAADWRCSTPAASLGLRPSSQAGSVLTPPSSRPASAMDAGFPTPAAGHF